MADKKWKGKNYAAACLGSGMMLAALAFAQNYQDDTVLASEEGGVTLAIAGETEEMFPTLPQTQETTELQEIQLSLADELQKASTLSETTEAEEQEEQTEITLETEAKEEAKEENSTEMKEKNTGSVLETTTTGENGVIAMDVSGIVENCMPSIVAISNKTVQEVESYLYGTQEIESENVASGIIIAQDDTELMIATNNHVVEDAKEMTVCFSVETEDPELAVVSAITKGIDKEHDLAVVAVKLADIPEEIRSQLKIATLGSSNKLKVGETAIAIGNALGSGQTVTCGIISALEREITTDIGTFTEIQTDAAINFGCSGGALLNKRGEVIGINSAKATFDYAESMGYAIPIDEAIPILTNLINRETRETVENHGYLGITVVPVSQEAREMYNMPAGAFVYEVTEGSAAEKAGLKKGDIITRFDGISIDSSDTLVDTLGYYEAGETVTIEIKVSESGEYVAKEIEVTLQEGAPQETEENKQLPSEQEPETEIMPSLPDQYGDGYEGDEEYGMDDGMDEFFNDFFNGGNGADPFFGGEGGLEPTPYRENEPGL